MGYFLQFDGVDDYIVLPTMTFTEIVVDFVVRPESGKYYFDARAGVANSYIFRHTTSGKDVTSSAFLTITDIYVDDVKRTDPFDLQITPNTRVIFKVVLKSAGTDNVNILSNNENTNSMNADLYSVKVYNSGTLIVHYDFTTQAGVSGTTAVDQSGNENHATINGATLMSDGQSSNLINVTGASLGISSVSATPILIKNVTGNTKGSTQLSAHKVKKVFVSASSLGSSTVSFSKSAVVKKASGSSSGISNVTATHLLVKKGSGKAIGRSTVSANKVKMISVYGQSFGNSWIRSDMGGNQDQHDRHGEFFGLLD